MRRVWQGSKKLVSAAITQFLLTTAYAEEVLHSAAEWKTKHEIVFGDVAAQIRSTGIKFDWTDPDESEAEDVIAYVRALHDKAAELRKVVGL